MKKMKLFLQILKTSGVDTLLWGFVAYLIVFACIISFFEPNIDGIYDSLWYCFATVTTIGYGDFVAITGIGRVLTVFLGIYGIVVITICTGVVLNYFAEVQKLKYNESVANFIYQLEHLDQLSKEELKELSKRVKKRKI